MNPFLQRFQEFYSNLDEHILEQDALGAKAFVFMIIPTFLCNLPTGQTMYHLISPNTGAIQRHRLCRVLHALTKKCHVAHPSPIQATVEPTKTCDAPPTALGTNVASNGVIQAMQARPILLQQYPAPIGVND